MRAQKAVLPVAGMGTRFLPITKAVPKELLPLVDRPCLAYVIAEAVEAGLGDIVLVTSRGKSAIEDYFDRSPALEASLAAAGKESLLREVLSAARLARVVSVRQQEPRGLGHAVLQALPAVGNVPFAVMLPDDIVDAETPAIGQLLAAQGSADDVVIALRAVPREKTNRYGICAGPTLGEGLIRIDTMVEKPDPAVAPSTLSIVGRYLLPADIFGVLAETAPGRGGEIQLTDALAVLAGQGRATGVMFSGHHFDTGNPVGLLAASIHYALKHPAYGAETAELLRRYA